MALGDVEFLEVAPLEPFHAVVVDRWVVVPDRRRDTPSGNVPAGSLAVFDSLANTAEAWKGLGFENDIAATADHAWIISHALATPTRSSRTLTWPSWLVVGAALPTTLASGKTTVVTATCTDTTDAATIAAGAVQS